jgi:penicillin amidase
MRRGALAGILAAALACAPPAAARIIQAGSVLPPGQSGFVSFTGLADGTGSPHLNDQTGLFVSFGLKPDMLNGPGQAEDPKDGVHIVRDAYGVPDVTGRTDEDAWWGAGYAIAQDRLFQLELFRRAATGRLSEILGRDYLPMDVLTRTEFFTPEELDAQLAALPPAAQTEITSYADGVNAWIDKTRTDPSKLPGEFAALGVGEPAPWTARDTVAVGVYLARTIPSGDGEELDNLQAFQKLPADVFDKVLPLRQHDQVATIPAKSGVFPSQPGRTRKQERQAFARSAAFARGLPIPAPQDDVSNTKAQAEANRLPLIGHLGLPEGSDAWAIRGPNHRAALFTGPQLGYSIPELLVELEVHGPGLDVRGATAPGIPLVGIGHNDHVAWGLTSGESDDDDLYAEQMVDQDHYRYKGQVLALDCRDETFDFHPPPTAATDLPGLIGQLTGGGSNSAPAGSETRRICRSVHGPIVARAGNVAYARRYAIWGRELHTLVGFEALQRARSVQDVGRAMADMTWNENCTAADDQGHIGYWHPGLLPLKPLGWDERLPYPGTGEAEWRGLMPVNQRPHAIDPKQGYLFNWNNMPSTGWTDGDAPDRNRMTGKYHHADFLGLKVRDAARRFSFDSTRGVDRLTGTISEGRPIATPTLRKARRGATGPAAAVLDTLLRWDGSYDRTGPDGKVDPGVATWLAFKAAVVDQSLGRFGDAVKLIGGAPEQGDFETSLGESYGLRTLSSRGLRAAAAQAFQKLEQQFDSRNPADWRMARPMEHPSAQGAGVFPDFPKFDRGTWQQAVELGP